MRWRACHRALALALGIVALGPGPAGAQDGAWTPGGAFADPDALGLWEAAVDYRLRLDDALLSYTAVVRQRVGAGLRMPLKDRMLYRVESAHRVFWSQTGDLIVQVLALREQTPMGVEEEATNHGLFDSAWDPLNDQLFFGLVEVEEDRWEPESEDFHLEHPLEPGYRDHYRYAIGDTVTLSLPTGDQVHAVELQVVPARADVRRLVGSLWIEPTTGALVRAVYRLADGFDAMRDIQDLREEEERGEFRFVPGLFKPWTAEVTMIAVEYGLWDMDLWLPRSLRAEGVATAGIVKAPATVEISYEIEAVTTEADLAAEAEGTDPVEERHFQTRSDALRALASATVADMPYELEGGWSRRRGPRGERRVRYLVPEDREWLRANRFLPPPVWESAPGFPSAEEMDELHDLLDDLPQAPLARMPLTFRWGLQRPDLVRYNRVEGLSVGARLQVRPHVVGAPLTATLSTRVGVADLEPSVRLDLVREGIQRRVTVSGYNELAAVDEDARHLGLGNSVQALLFGRDDGEYYRRSGATVAWSPAASRPQRFEVRGWGEYHRAVGVGTDFSLWHLAADTFAVRNVIAADPGWEVGGGVRVAPWWGTDPRMVQGGLDARLSGAGGMGEYVRGALTARLAVPLPGDLRMGLEGGGGAVWGSPPVQRLFYVGGATTLRGYGPTAAVGTAVVRGRAEVALQRAFGALSLFGDAAWAGARDDLLGTDVLRSVGVGVSLVDGLIRVDAAWGLDGSRPFRLEAYLDGIL